jgi:hypothetical protein
MHAAAYPPTHLRDLLRRLWVESGVEVASLTSGYIAPGLGAVE